MIDLDKIQKEVLEYSVRNFGPPGIRIKHNVESFLGIVEEVGEVAHHILKMSEGIDGDEQKHLAEIEDGLGDIMIFCLDECGRNGMNAERIIQKVWDKVKQRDFVKNKIDGGRKDVI